MGADAVLELDESVQYILPSFEEDDSDHAEPVDEEAA